jgi:hypothetical protein
MWSICSTRLLESTSITLAAYYSSNKCLHINQACLISIVPGLLVNLLHHRENRKGWGEGGRGWRQQERYLKSNLQKTASIVV